MPCHPFHQGELRGWPFVIPRLMLGAAVMFLGAKACLASNGRTLQAGAVSREVEVTHRYLNLPVRSDAPRRTVCLYVDDRLVRAFETELAEGPADFWAFTDVSPWQGHHMVIDIEPIGRLAPEESQKISREHPIARDAIDRLSFGDNIVDADQLFHERLRPQFHFTTPRGWLNDPNGLIYHAGEYHLFYQLQPFSMKSLNSDKCWGHAVSKDLVHWDELPVALRPDENGGIWSGSVIVERRNVGGFQTGTEEAMVLFYTATGRSAMNPKPAEPSDFVQRIAFSNDRGRSWKMFSGNPVMKYVTPLNRDPLVFWHEPSKRWVMVLYVGYPISNPGNHYTAQIFSSENLKDWTYQSRVEGLFDCPMLFEIALDGNRSDTRWIIHCANMKYRVGQFDGKAFTPETEFIDSHPGRVRESAYAPQIFRDAPDGRVIQMAWLYTDVPLARQQMTFPSELSLVTTPAGPRLRWRPVPEIEGLYGKDSSLHEVTLADGSNPTPCGRGRHLEIDADVNVGDAREIELNIRGVPVVLHALGKQVTVLGYALPVKLEDGKLRLRALVDETSLEIFADDGLAYLPLAMPAGFASEDITICARGGSARAASLRFQEIKSIATP